MRILFAHTTIVILLLCPASGFAGSIAAKTGPASNLRVGVHWMVATDRLSDLPVFTDVAAAVGMKTRGYTFSNPIWGDFDGDGDLDLFADNHFNKAPYLYQNNRDGTFTNIFATSGLVGPGDRHGSVWVDYDNDGDLDLSITLGAAHGHALGEKKTSFTRMSAAGSS